MMPNRPKACLRPFEVPSKEGDLRFCVEHEGENIGIERRPVEIEGGPVELLVQVAALAQKVEGLRGDALALLRVEAVEHTHGVTCCEQGIDQVRADESCTSCYKNLHNIVTAWVGLYDHNLSIFSY